MKLLYSLFCSQTQKNAKLNNSATNQINVFPVEKFTQALFQERTKDK